MQTLTSLWSNVLLGCVFYAVMEKIWQEIIYAMSCCPQIIPVCDVKSGGKSIWSIIALGGWQLTELGYGGWGGGGGGNVGKGVVSRLLNILPWFIDIPFLHWMK